MLIAAVAGFILVLTDIFIFASGAGGASAVTVATVEDGAVVLVLGALLFLQARLNTRSMEEAASRREFASRALHTYLDASPIAIVSFGVEGRVATWNPQATRIFGWLEDEVTGKPDPSVIEGLSAAFQAQFQRVLAGERLDDHEETRRGKGGAQIEVFLTMMPMKDAAGEVIGVISFIEDISQRKLEREALIDTNRVFRSTFEDAAIGMAMTSLEGRWLKVNKALCEILGYSEGELLATTFQDVTFPDDLQAAIDLNRRMVEGRIASYQIEKRYVRKGGGIVWVAQSASVVHDAGGSSLYSIEQLQDITSRKAAEEELKSYSVGLEQMVKERTEELEEAHRLLVQAERLAAIGTVAAQVAHDLRNPLTAINTHLYYIKNVLPSRLGKKVDQSVNEMEGAVAHSSKIIDDLLEYSRAADLKEERLDLSDFVKRCAEALTPPPSVEVKLDLEPGLAIVGDVAKLKRVFQNVISNSFEAMPDGGTVAIWTKEDGDRVITEVVDTGTGMNERTRQQLFTPFFTTKARGLGLGLAICRRLVEAHGGEIRVESEEGKGTRVTVSLPKGPSA